MQELTKQERITVLSVLEKISRRKPSSFISGSYIKSMKVLKEEYQKHLRGEPNNHEEELLQDFIDVEFGGIETLKICSKYHINIENLPQYFDLKSRYNNKEVAERIGLHRVTIQNYVKSLKQMKKSEFELLKSYADKKRR